MGEPKYRLEGIVHTRSDVMEKNAFPLLEKSAKKASRFY